VATNRTRITKVTCVRDILGKMTKWWEAGETFGLATVTRTYRSAPRDPGAALAVAAAGDQEVIGSVSGGCVEGRCTPGAGSVRVRCAGAAAVWGQR